MKQILSIVCIAMFAHASVSAAEQIHLKWQAPQGPVATLEYLSQNNIEIRYQLFRTKSAVKGPDSTAVADIIIDDGDTGADADGSWSVSGAAGFYGKQSLFSRDQAATYSFKAQTPGRYKVSLWWTQFSSRSADVPVEIYDGNNLLTTVHIDQKLNGGQWNDLGTYEFNDHPRVRIISTGTGSTCVDALKLSTDIRADFDWSAPIYDGVGLEYHDEQNEPGEYLYMVKAYYTTSAGETMFSGNSNIERAIVKSSMDLDAPILSIKRALDAIQESINEIKYALGMLNEAQGQLK